MEGMEEMSKEAIRCSECEYCKEAPSGTHSSRGSFYCKHPNQKFIKNYYKENRISRMVGFIDYGKPYGHAPKLKTAPRWCPLKKED